MSDTNEKQNLIQEMLVEVERLLLTDSLSEQQKCSVLQKIIDDHKQEISQGQLPRLPAYLTESI